MKPAVKDPWRTGKVAVEAPKRNPARKVDDDEAHVVGTANSDHPLDWDLKMVSQYLLRAPHQDYAILIANAHNAVEACHVLLRAAHNPTLKLVLEAAGFQLGTQAQAKPTGFTLQDDEWVLWDPQAPDVPNGFRRLVQTLLRACREERGFRDRLQQLGVTPIMP